MTKRSKADRARNSKPCNPVTVPLEVSLGSQVLLVDEKEVAQRAPPAALANLADSVLQPEVVSIDKTKPIVLGSENVRYQERDLVNVPNRPSKRCDVGRYYSSCQWAFPRFCNYVDSDVKSLQAFVPSLIAKDLYASNKSNGHALAAAIRNISEMVVLRLAINSCIYDKVTGFIHDVGGAAGRHRSLGRDYVHSTNPILSGQDVVRWVDGSYDGIRCDHMADVCDCHPFTASISVHSLYYLDPNELAQIISKQQVKRHFAVLHPFWRQPKKIHGALECVYLDDRVVCTAAGNMHVYEHGNMSWLIEKDFAETAFGILGWRLEYDYGDTVILSFALAAPNVTLKKKVASVFADVKHRESKDPTEKPVLTRIRKTLDPGLEGDAYDDIFIKRFSYTHAGSAAGFKMFLGNVHRDAIDAGLNAMLAQKRAALFWTHQERFQESSLPIYIDEDVRHHNNMLNLNHTCWSKFTRSVGWLFHWLFMILIFPFIWLFSKIAQRDDLVLNYNRPFYRFKKLSLLDVCGLYDYCSGYIPTHVVDEDKITRYRPARTTQCVPKPYAYPMLYVRDVVPIVFRNCAHNINKCFEQRVGLRIPDGGATLSIPDNLRSVFARIKIELQPLDFEGWVSRFPGIRQKVLRREYDEFLASGASITNFSKFFIKRELSQNCDKAPRPIHANHVALSFEVGRWLVPLGELLQIYLVEINICFPYDGDMESMEDFVAEFSHADIKDNDFTSFDASERNRHLAVVYDCYELCGVPCETIDLMRMDFEGVTVVGNEKFKYQGSNIRFSGRGDTLIGNTLLTILLVLCVLRDRFLALMAKGDDSNTFDKGGITAEEMADRYREYGMVPKTRSVRPDDLEFCSMVMMPDSDGKMRFAPKIGRLLAKTFWCKQLHLNMDQQTQLFLGILMGLEKKCSQVPIIRGLFRSPVYLRNVCKGVYIDKDSYYLNQREKTYQVDEYAVIWAALRYGLSPVDVLELEDQLASVDRVPYELTDPRFRKITDFDFGVTHGVLSTPLAKVVFQPGLAFLEVLLEESFALLIGPLFVVFLIVFETYYGGYNLHTIFGHVILGVLRCYSSPLAFILHLLNNLFCSFLTAGNKHIKFKKLSCIASMPKKNRSSKVSKEVKKIAKDLAKQVIVSSGAFLGGRAGSYVGASDVGARVGRRAAKQFSKLIGTGDYQVRGNTLTGNQVPTFMRSGRGIRVVHREYLGDVLSSVAYTSTRFNLNPGLNTTFPWLSNIARNFQQYDFKGLVFEFKSTSADALNSTNTALGAMILATQYDALQPAFNNKADMENYEYSTSVCPAESMLHPIECAPNEKTIKLQYVRQGAIPDGADARFYDLGVTTIAAVGMQAAATVGELWVSYDVELFKPIVNPGSYSALFNRIANAGYTNTNILGSTQIAPYGNLGGSISATGSGYDTFNFPVQLASGYYLVVAVWSGSSTASLALTATYNNCTLLTSYLNADNATTTSSTLLREHLVQITGRDASIVYSAATLPTSGTSVSLWVAQVGYPD